MLFSWVSKALNLNVTGDRAAGCWQGSPRHRAGGHSSGSDERRHLLSPI